tara:strand:- start:2005 stop:2718 length:714 start_codon:yes stop_codon:yes gene_type:complete
MRNYFDEAEFYANENYSNASGWSRMGGPDSLGYDYFGGPASQNPYSYASAGGSNQNPAASLPFVINIANSSTAAVTGVKIMGANASLSATGSNFGNVAAITITMDNGTVTYGQFLQSIISEPFRVGLMYLQSTTANQPFNQITISYTEPNGRVVTTPVTPALDPMQQQSGVTVVRQMFPVNANTELQTTILAEATLTLRLYPSEQLDISRTLSGLGAGKSYGAPDGTLNQQGIVQGM